MVEGVFLQPDYQKCFCSEISFCYNGSMNKILLVLTICLIFLVSCLKTPKSEISPVNTETIIHKNTEGSPIETETINGVVEPSAEVVAPWMWPRSTPEDLGLSSAILADMLEQIQKDNKLIHSIQVVRHGVLVLEAYLSGYWDEIIPLFWKNKFSAKQIGESHISHFQRKVRFYPASGLLNLIMKILRQYFLINQNRIDIIPRIYRYNSSIVKI